MEELTIAVDGRLMLDTSVLPTGYVPRSDVPEPAPLLQAPEPEIEPAVVPAPPPTPWPSVPTPIQWTARGVALALVWQDEAGVRWLCHAYGDPLTLPDFPPTATKEIVGVPVGAREAAARLPQDCGCVAHQGPHWLHMDLFDREVHADLLWPVGQHSQGYFAFAIEEKARIGKLVHAMRAAGMERLPWAKVRGAP